MKFTFRTKLFIYFVEIILCTSIPIAIITYNYSYNSLKDNLVSNAQEQMAKVDIIFSNMIKQMKADTSFLARSQDIKKANESISALFNIPDIELHNKYSKQIPGLENSIYNQFEFYGETHPQTTYVYIGTKWGGYIQWPDGLSAGKFDPRERPWYKLALRDTNQVEVTEPYMSAIDNSNNVIISTAKSIKDESGNVVGVVGIDVSLKTLSETISSIKIGNTGYAFLFLKDGTMLAHPDSNLNFKNIMQLNELGYTSNKTDGGAKYSFENYNKFLDKDNSTFETNINGSPVIVNVYTSPYTGWKMASVIQKSELVASANKIGYIIALVTLGVFLFVILITIIITRKLTKPITELTPIMNAAGNGDFGVRADIKTNDEFGQLGSSFNLMIGQLSSSYEELSAVYEELVATEEELKAQYDELQYNEEALRNSEERYRLALECANDSIWDWNLVTDEFFVSDKIYDIVGYKINKNRKITEIINELVHPNDLNILKKDFNDHINNITKIYLSEFRIKTNEGSYAWISSRGKAIRDSEDKVIKLAGAITDISNRKIVEERIKFMAYYDSLTKLPNRTLFLNKLNEQLESLSDSNIKGAVFFIDLDNFKNINDTLGHDYGDKLLIHLAKEFESLIDEKDTICRLGGDEFILLHPYDKESRVEYYARRLLDLFKEPFKIDERQIYSTASIGIALYPKDGIDTNTILKNADSAMYKAKELGKNRYMLFDPEMYLKLERKICIERILRTAIENNELSINYQPQYNAQNNEIFGFEALVRLNSKELGFISPLEFIPIAEECGFITKLGKWVLSESCKQSVAWLNAGYKFKSMSINISSVDLQQAGFLENVKNILEETSINPNIVELEITETVLMQSLDASIEILKKLMNMGIRIALDDFGTGYSSLSYLRKIPISTLKIDKSFIDNITSNKKEEAIINNIIQMAHSMDLKIVAEGVEVEEQLSILKERKCDYIQGYYFSKPLSASEAEKLLEKETNIL
jgi:diguanylate cyclase (GGDEF)-like protein/PAS domain S-box-containing protein